MISYLVVTIAPKICPNNFWIVSLDVNDCPISMQSSIGPQGHASASSNACVHQMHSRNNAIP